MPKHFLAYKFPLKTNKAKRRKLERLCHEQCDLYNDALRERIEAWRMCGKSVSFYDQNRSLTEIRKEFPEWHDTPLSLQRGTLKRLDKAYKAFFKRGGFPKFKRRVEWATLEFAQFDGIQLLGGKLVSKAFGRLRVNMHRPIEGDIKSVKLTLQGGKWYVCFCCAVEAKEPVAVSNPVGLDAGIKTLVATSDGQFIGNPKFGEAGQRKLRKAQRKLARAKRGSARRKKTRLAVSRVYRKIASKRRDYQHKITTALVRQYDFIAVEALATKNMLRNHRLSRAIADASWRQLMDMLEYKCALAGHGFARVDPRNTSQACSECGLIVKKDLSVRRHECECGYSEDRDVNAARNILGKSIEDGRVLAGAKVGGYAVLSPKNTAGFPSGRHATNQRLRGIR